MKTVNVNLGEKSYPIHITSGCWELLLEKLETVLNGRKILVISDENVSPLYFDEVKNILESMGYDIYSAVVPPGEKSKSLRTAETLYSRCLDVGLDRFSAIAALGGGVVGDLSGFVASTYMRGVNFIQIPTTLLAQVDSSVGGKTAVNHPLAKNIIGTFYQPRMVLINVNTLKTLPGQQFSCGMAELIKYGFIWDEEFLHWLEENINRLMSLDVQALSCAIYHSCRIKAQIVEKDEKENGVRAILNFGHTIGHAIEALGNFSAYTHGEAVALGMIYESRLAMEMGLVDKEYLERLSRLLAQAGLPLAPGKIDCDGLIEKMHHDKKNRNGKITFVLPVAPGKVKIFDNINSDLIRKVLKSPQIQGG